MTYSVKLTPRVAPVQARARQRVADILDAAQALLETDAKVTTSTIAAQARIPAGSIYRYCPNVHSVYRNLFEKLSVGLREQIAIVISKTDSKESWDVLLQEILKNSIGFFSITPLMANCCSGTPRRGRTWSSAQPFRSCRRNWRRDGARVTTDSTMVMSTTFHEWLRGYSPSSSNAISSRMATARMPFPSSKRSRRCRPIFRSIYALVPRVLTLSARPCHGGNPASDHRNALRMRG